MPALRVRELTVRYPARPEPALEGVTMAVEPGGVVAVTGRTGAGKSTLALAAAGLLPRVVRATVNGTVHVGDIDATHATAADLVGQVGIVFSAPALQLSASKPTVREELAFGLENLAVPRADMDMRIDEAMARLRVAHLAERDPLSLSGGEQQRVAVACIVVMGTGLIVLDEPAAQLDPQGTAEIAALIGEIAADGRAVAITEHAPEVLAAADQCVVLDRGRVVAADAPAVALAGDAAASAGVEAPTLLALAKAAGLPAKAGFDEEAIAKALGRSPPAAPAAGAADGTADPGRGEALEFVRGAPPVAVEVRNLVHRYPGGVEAVRGVDLTLAPGETVAIVGQNGSGKTTLVKHLNGLLRPDQGTVFIDGRDIARRLVSDLAAQVGFVFQNPDDQLFNSRVDREVGFGPRNLRLDASQVERLVESALAITGLDGDRATNPYDLDVSIRKLVALAGVLAMEPPVLVLDEPTMGQDAPGKRRIASIIDAWAASDRTVVCVTHDMEFAARHFKRIVVMRRGEIVLDASPAVAFAPQNAALLESTGLRPPPAARIATRLGLKAAPADVASLLAML